MMSGGALFYGCPASFVPDEMRQTEREELNMVRGKKHTAEQKSVATG
jgi:hypothetical protein